MDVSNRLPAKISPAGGENANQGHRRSCDRQPPALSYRPWFFSLLPLADVRRTEISLNTAQRRVTGFIRFITGCLVSDKDVKTAVVPSEELLTAAKEGTVEAVKKHISSSADIHRVDQQGMNATMYAAERGDLDIIKALVVAGSRINAANEQGKTALMMAVLSGHADVVEYLIRWGADVAKTDSKGLTALMFAADKGNEELIELLLEHGASINQADDKDRTALTWAAWDVSVFLCARSV